MPLIIKELPKRENKVIRLGREPEPPVEPQILKPIEEPQIKPEMPEAIEKVQEVLAPKRRRGRPRKEII